MATGPSIESSHHFLRILLRRTWAYEVITLTSVLPSYLYTLNIFWQSSSSPVMINMYSFVFYFYTYFLILINEKT